MFDWKRLAALLLTLLCLAPAAFAQEEEEDVPKNVVDALFQAVAGTTKDIEEKARRKLEKEEIAERNALNAAYREQTRLWLIEALTPVEEELAVPSPTPTPAATPAPDETPQPVLDPEAVYNLFLTSVPGQAYVELMSALGYDGAEACMQGTKEYYEQWRATIDVEKLMTINDDYAAWIYLPGSMIDYPVVHGSDNEYYLDHLFNGGRNSCGTLFVDYRNLPHFQEANTLIYGHHMRNGSMFKAITYYARQAFFDANPYMLIIAPDSHFIVEILAAYTTDSSDHCYDFALSDYDDMREYIFKAKRKSNCETFVEVLPEDRLVTLSTCAYAFENARYIAIGKLTQTWEKPEVIATPELLTEVEDQDTEEVSISLP